MWFRHAASPTLRSPSCERARSALEYASCPRPSCDRRRLWTPERCAGWQRLTGRRPDLFEYAPGTRGLQPRGSEGAGRSLALPHAALPRAGSKKACDPPAPAAWSDSTEVCAYPKSGCPPLLHCRAAAREGDQHEGADRHRSPLNKATNAVAAIDERAELLEYAVFSTNRAGLRSLARWGKRFPERRSLGGGRCRRAGTLRRPPCASSPLERWS